MDLSETPAALRAAAPHVVVIGDVILDGWWRGVAHRLTREAAAPVIGVVDRDWAPGGAANAACALAALGARVSLIAVCGDDRDGALLRELLTDAGVDTAGLVADPGATARKVRVSVDGQVLLRLDDPASVLDPFAVQRRLAELTSAALDEADAVLVADYGTGLLHGPVRHALRRRPDRPWLTVDAHDPELWRSVSPDAVTPSVAEAAAILRSTLSSANAGTADPAGAVASAHRDLVERTGAAVVVVTLDRDGAIAVDRDGVLCRTRAHPAPERQASGAGDSFAAALTAAAAIGVPLERAMEVAQAVADVVVRRPGTAVCTIDDLESELRGPEPLDLDALVALVGVARADGRRVVFTNGCFDVLHRGHTAYLRDASRLGDVLVVAVNSDASTRRLKGSDRPVNGIRDRAAVLAALDCVDAVIEFDDDTPIALIERIRPEVYAKGGDYTPQMLAEAEVVESYGGEVAILGYVQGRSTTSILERIRTEAP